MIKQCVRNAAHAVLVVCALLMASGCGGVLYAANAGGAAAKLQEAEELGAASRAPYEYYYAREHLKKAMEEAAQGDYGDALNFLNSAEEYADKAIKFSREAHRGAGR